MDLIAEYGQRLTLNSLYAWLCKNVSTLFMEVYCEGAAKPLTPINASVNEIGSELLKDFANSQIYRMSVQGRCCLNQKKSPFICIVLQSKSIVILSSHSINNF